MRPTNQDGLMPSILDRLLDSDSGGTAAQPGYTVHQMYKVVQRDLEDLLNTRQTTANLPKEFEELHNSIYAYGIPDMTSMTEVVVENRLQMARVIENIIEQFEPRLRDIRVKFVPGQGDGEKDRSLKFHVDARLRLDPAPEVAFDTVLELGTGKYEVSDRGA